MIGRFEPGNPPALADRQRIDLQQLPDHPDLWRIEAVNCGLTQGRTYHYWFEANDSNPAGDGRRILCTDPAAFTVDWPLLADPLTPPYDADDRDPAAVVKFENGQLVPCDPGGEIVTAAPPFSSSAAPPNNRMVIYELPPAWTRTNVQGNPQIGVGTFRDVRALIESDVEAANFADTPALGVGRSHLSELGVNALELLPLADSFVEREWGYATSNYYAPDHDLGFPEGHSSPTANTDLRAVIAACHARGIRFITDMVMAFGTRAPMENVNYPDFHIDPAADAGDPDVVCLLTALGIPMILAGQEFADQHDLSVSHPPRQRDAVNFERVDEPFRRRIFDYVARLVKFRTSSDAFSVNDTDFLYVDFNDGKRVIAWRRGEASGEQQVVVVANFSDFMTANATSPTAEYRVPNCRNAGRQEMARDHARAGRSRRLGCA